MSASATRTTPVLLSAYSEVVLQPPSLRMGAGTALDNVLDAVEVQEGRGGEGSDSRTDARVTPMSKRSTNMFATNKRHAGLARIAEHSALGPAQQHSPLPARADSKTPRGDIASSGCPNEEGAEDLSGYSLDDLRKKLQRLNALRHDKGSSLAKTPGAFQRFEARLQGLTAEIARREEEEEERREEREVGEEDKDEGGECVEWSDEDKVVLEAGSKHRAADGSLKAGSEGWLSSAKRNQQEANLICKPYHQGNGSFFDDHESEAPPRPRTGSTSNRNTRGAQMVKASTRGLGLGLSGRRASGNMVTTPIARRSLPLSSAAASAQTKTLDSAQKQSEERRSARLSLNKEPISPLPITRLRSKQQKAEPQVVELLDDTTDEEDASARKDEHLPFEKAAPIALRATRRTCAAQPALWRRLEGLKAIYPSGGGADSIPVTPDDLSRLAPEEFLNDTIIDMYMKYLWDRLEPEVKARCHFFGSYFYNKLTEPTSGEGNMDRNVARHDKVKRWTKNVDIFAKDFLFIPIHGALHWSLVIVSHPGHFVGKTPPCCLFHLDSMSGSHKTNTIAANLRPYFQIEWKVRSELSPDSVPGVWRAAHPDDDVPVPKSMKTKRLMLPRQGNHTDCGLFLLAYLQYFLHSVPNIEYLDCDDLKSLQDRTYAQFFSKQWFSPNNASLLRGHLQNIVLNLFLGQAKFHPEDHRLELLKEQIAQYEGSSTKFKSPELDILERKQRQVDEECEAQAEAQVAGSTEQCNAEEEGSDRNALLQEEDSVSVGAERCETNPSCSHAVATTDVEITATDGDILLSSALPESHLEANQAQYDVSVKSGVQSEDSDREEEDDDDEDDDRHEFRIRPADPQPSEYAAFECNLEPPQDAQAASPVTPPAPPEQSCQDGPQLVTVSSGCGSKRGRDSADSVEEVLQEQPAGDFPSIDARQPSTNAVEGESEGRNLMRHTAGSPVRPSEPRRTKRLSRMKNSREDIHQSKLVPSPLRRPENEEDKAAGGQDCTDVVLVEGEDNDTDGIQHCGIIRSEPGPSTQQESLKGITDRVRCPDPQSTSMDMELKIHNNCVENDDSVATAQSCREDDLLKGKEPHALVSLIGIENQWSSHLHDDVFLPQQSRNPTAHEERPEDISDLEDRGTLSVSE